AGWRSGGRGAAAVRRARAGTRGGARLRAGGAAARLAPARAVRRPGPGLARQLAGPGGHGGSAVMTLPPGEVQFTDDARPELPADDYRVVVGQHVQLPPEFASPPEYRTEQRFRVTGPRFGLEPGDV